MPDPASSRSLRALTLLGNVPLLLALAGQALGVWQRQRWDDWRAVALVGVAVGVASLVPIRRSIRLGRPLPWFAWLTGIAIPISFWLTVLDLVLWTTTPLARSAVGLLALTLLHSLVLAFVMNPRPRTRLGRMGLRLSLAASAAGTALFLVEFAFAAVVPAFPYEVIPDDPSRGEMMLPDEDVRMRLNPGFAGSYMHPEFPGTRVVINDLGMRDSLDESPPQPSERSVLCLGDSFVFGTGVELEETFHWILERDLNEGNPTRVRVYGAGVPGLGQYDCLALLHRCAPTLRPDVVVLAIQESNDFSDNLRFHNRKAASERDLEDNEEEEEAGDGTLDRSRALSVPRFLRRARRASYWFGSSSLLTRIRPVVEESLVELGWLDPSVSSNRLFTMMMQETATPVSLLAFQEMKNAVTQFKQSCEEIGARLVLVVIPAALQAEPDRYADFLSIQDESTRDEFDRETLHRSLLRTLGRHDVPVVDLLPRLDREARAGRSGYHREGHFNRHGHQLMAEALRPIMQNELASR